MNFTYEPPPGDKFLNALKKVFASENRRDIKLILDKCISLEITTNGQFTGRKWNEYEAYANFRTDFETIDRITIEIRRIITSKCNTLMPQECGLDIKSVEFSPSIDLINDEESVETIISGLAEVTDRSDAKLVRKLLDSELVEKGRDLSHVYHILFIVENSLRRFVDITLNSALGSDYFDHISLNKGIRQNIQTRKNQEQKHKWIRIRGDSEIYYLDFIDLSDVIVNNWQHFKGFFPDQAWIQVKIDELYRCRCLIAHNSDISDHEVDVIRTNYRSILLQLSQNPTDDLPF